MAGGAFDFAAKGQYEYVNWNEIAKQVTTAIDTKQKLIDKNKKELDQKTLDFTETVEKLASPDQDMQGAATELGMTTMEAMNNLNKLFKNQRISYNDYVMKRQRLQSGVNNYSNILTNDYNKQFEDVNQRTKEGKNQETERWLMEQTEGFTNFLKYKAVVNPYDYSVNFAKKQLADPSKPYNKQTNPYTNNIVDNPDDFLSMNVLATRINARYDYWDANKQVSEDVDKLGELARVIAGDKVDTREGFIQALKDDRYTNYEQQMIDAYKERPTWMLSYLTENLGVAPNGKPFKPTFNAEEANKKGNEHLILLNDAQPPMPVFNSTQDKAFEDSIRVLMRAQLDDINTAASSNKFNASGERLQNDYNLASVIVDQMGKLYDGKDEDEISGALAQLSSYLPNKKINYKGRNKDGLILGVQDYVYNSTTGQRELSKEDIKTFSFGNKNKKDWVASLGATFSPKFDITRLLPQVIDNTTFESVTAPTLAGIGNVVNPNVANVSPQKDYKSLFTVIDPKTKKPKSYSVVDYNLTDKIKERFDEGGYEEYVNVINAGDFGRQNQVIVKANKALTDGLMISYQDSNDNTVNIRLSNMGDLGSEKDKSKRKTFDQILEYIYNQKIAGNPVDNKEIRRLAYNAKMGIMTSK